MRRSAVELQEANCVTERKALGVGFEPTFSDPITVSDLEDRPDYPSKAS